jgi:hypothetical protein
MTELINKLKTFSNVKVSEKESTHLVEITFLPNYYFKIVIAYNVFEWFVNLYDFDSNQELWSDWSDWYISGEVTKANRHYYFKADIEYFITRVLEASDFRIRESSGLLKIFEKEFFKVKNLQAKINGEWIDIEVGELPVNFKSS